MGKERREKVGREGGEGRRKEGKEGYINKDRKGM